MKKRKKSNKKGFTPNNTYYFYDTLKSYLNMFDPTDTSKLATYQTNSNDGAKSKVIILIPYNGMCDLHDNSDYFTIPDATLVKNFIEGANTLKNPSVDIPSTLSNYSIANNVKFLGGSKPCTKPTTNSSQEPALDVISTGMMSSGCPFEYWITKYGLLGLLTQIQELAQTKDKDEKWLFSLSWGTYDLCGNMAWAAKHLDIAQTCSAITYGKDGCSTSSPCTVSNQEYINLCEAKFKDLTENSNCLFFVSSGDTGCVSDDTCYKVDYPTSSNYTISVGGVDYTNTVQNQSSSNSSYFNLAQKVNKRADGIALPLSYTERSQQGSFDFTTGGMFDAVEGLMATGGGFTNGDNGDIKATDAQKPFLNAWFNDKSTPKPSAWMSSNGATWNSSNPQTGTPDISGCMANGLFVGFPISASDKYQGGVINPVEIAKPINLQDTTNPWMNADGTSFSSPLIASFFAVLFSYVDLPAGKSLRDFLYENPTLFNKPSKPATNDFITSDNTPCAGFTCTTKSGTWDPCVGLGTPDFLAIYKVLKG